MSTEVLTFEEWPVLGVERGFCSQPSCTTHDSFPSTLQEHEEWETGGDPCVPGVRLYYP